MPNCSLAGCGVVAAVQWSRRPTDTELAALVAAENDNRATVLANADPTLPTPVFGSLPDATNTVVSVYGCVTHGIALDLAPFTHQSSCTAPNTANLPNCDCTPEPLVQAAITPATPPDLPSGW